MNLPNQSGSMSSQFIIQGKCWLNFTPNKAEQVVAETERLNYIP